MYSPMVSIVIPVYKVEAYLRRCVNSVLSQTLTEWELILVDDGSPDNCPEICDYYAHHDSRIRVIHKQNGGLASARNAGMKIACGKWLFLLDSDDWIDPETLEELVSVAEHSDVDFVRFRPVYAGWPNYEDGSLCDFGTEGGLHEGLYEKESIRKEIFPRLFATPQLTLGPIVAAWRSMYRRCFLVDNKLWFDEKVRYSEDTIFSAKVVMATNSFYYLDGGRYYHYFYNPGSITKSFKADRWESCRNLICCFERDFSDCAEFDFTNQLWLQKIYCILSALGQRQLLHNRQEREVYCAQICKDPITVEACRHLHLVRASWKQRVMLELIRMRMVKLISIL